MAGEREAQPAQPRDLLKQRPAATTQSYTAQPRQATEQLLVCCCVSSATPSGNPTKHSLMGATSSRAEHPGDCDHPHRRILTGTVTGFLGSSLSLTGLASACAELRTPLRGVRLRVNATPWPRLAGTCCTSAPGPRASVLPAVDLSQWPQLPPPRRARRPGPPAGAGTGLPVPRGGALTRSPRSPIAPPPARAPCRKVKMNF
jgi:hypothetical protein